MSEKYKILVDCGKPYEIEELTEQGLKKELDKLKAIAKKEESPYLDIFVYDDKGQDIIRMVERVKKMENKTGFGMSETDIRLLSEIKYKEEIQGEEEIIKLMV